MRLGIARALAAQRANLLLKGFGNAAEDIFVATLIKSAAVFS